LKLPAYVKDGLLLGRCDARRVRAQLSCRLATVRT
jgi:hypothetical protein